MATYVQLEAERWWIQETVAPAHAAFNDRMMAAFRLTPATCGSKGDNAHLYGRHRSRDWDLNSRYCTDRAYGTQDQRDRAGQGDWIRATDIGIAGPTHWAAAHRLDAAVRAGRLPGLAEWFGTFDGRVVTGWYEGHWSSADDSHLTHLHVGLWTASCNDQAQLQLLGDIITGAAASGVEETMLVQVKGSADVWVSNGLRRRLVAKSSEAYNTLVAQYGQPRVVSSADVLGWVAGPVDQELGDSTTVTTTGGPLTISLTGTAVPVVPAS